VASFTSSSGNIISIPQVINTDEELESLTTLLADFMTSEDDNIHNGSIVEIIALLISEYEETLPEIIEFNKYISSKN
jgi:hypothetical protein